MKRSVKGWVKSVLALVLTIGMAGLLTACGLRGDLPPEQLVGQAIALQVERTQHSLSQTLKLRAPTLKEIGVGHIRITDQAPLTILGQPAYQLQGTYDLTLRQSDRQAHRLNTRFEVFVLRQGEGKTVTWRVAQPDSAADSWVTQALPMP